MSDEKPRPCPFCGSAVDLLLLVKDDDNKYPRPHWHVSIECPCGATIGWEVVSEQLPDQYSPNDKSSPVIMERVNAYIARWNAAGQELARLHIIETVAVNVNAMRTKLGTTKYINAMDELAIAVKKSKAEGV